MSQTIENAVIALYISDRGELLASEAISGPLTISEDQLRVAPEAKAPSAQILSVDIAIAYKELTSGGTRVYGQSTRRICYDKSGHVVACF